MKHVLLLGMVISYTVAIVAVWLAYNHTAHGSISSVLGDKMVWWWVVCAMVAMGALAITYESYRGNSLSFCAIIILVVGILGMLAAPVAISPTAHYLFAAIIIISIVGWTFAVCPRNPILFLELVIVCVLIWGVYSSHSTFFVAEVVFLVLFAIAFLYEHFRYL